MNFVVVNLAFHFLCSSIKVGTKNYENYIVNNFLETILKVVLLPLSFALQYFGFNTCQFILLVVFVVFLFRPYLSKGSKLAGFCVTHTNRSWYDKLIWTSGVYFVAAFFAFCLEESEIASLCFVTFCGSTLYHRNREIKYFNLDNIFATSLLVVYSCTLASSFYVCQEYFYLGIFGLPVAAFLLVYCGMPAEVELDLSGLLCTRTNRPVYDTVHTLWHIISGVGPIMSVLYLHSVKHNNFSQFGIDTKIDSSHWITTLDSSVLPIMAVCIGSVINLSGNIAGIMPLD